MTYERKKVYCNSLNKIKNDLIVSLLKISTMFNNGMGKLDIYLFIK